MNSSTLMPIDTSNFPRHKFLDNPTPVQYLPRLSAHLGGVNIYVKREDLNVFGGGGNKLRKLELIIGDAMATGADTIITVGARQSNHARLTAAAAACVGLKCELVLSRTVPRFDDDYLETGNVLLDSIFGARVHDVPGTVDTLQFAQDRANELRSQGHTVYVCPVGGSSPIGCLGYFDCAAELHAQAKEKDILLDGIVLPNGTGGTHAGLISGFVSLGLDPSIITGFTVYSDATKAQADTVAKANLTLELLNSTWNVTEAAIRIDGGQLGEGYGIPTEGARAAIRLLGSTEGLLLDPVYSGKAFSGLLERIASGEYRSGQNILFIMTGGSPALYAYRKEF